MSWSNVKLILRREVRDQLRDKRTLFTIAVLPILLYPLLGMSFLQVTQFRRQHPNKILIVGSDTLPEKPALIETDEDNKSTFALSLCGDGESEAAKKTQGLMELTVRPLSGDDDRMKARDAVEKGKFDAVIYFPSDFSEQIEEYRNGSGLQSSSDDEGDDVPQPTIIYDTAKDKSNIAHDRLSSVLGRWRESLVKRHLKEQKLPPAVAKPFKMVRSDVAKKEERRAAIWSKILPFVVLIWALTGAFYPAIDLCAGEKERGTLETLLSSPARRNEIVWGKLLAIMVFSMATSVLNLFSMGVTGTFMIQRMQAITGGTLDFGPPPIASLGWLLLALIPISALFSALSLAVAAMARSTKEGQYYLMPLLLISLPLMTLPMLPGTELELGTALVPVTGVMLLLRALMEGEFQQALLYVVPVLAITTLCVLLAIRWAIHQFSNETVLFRESEQFEIGAWVRHIVRDRGDTPSVSEAILCGIMLLVIVFFAKFVVSAPGSFADLATTQATVLIALVATPAALMAIMLTRKPLASLLLRRAHWLAFPAVVLLAVCLHPLVVNSAAVLQQVYPISPDVLEQLKGMEKLYENVEMWQLILVMALLPAICEELAYRGFILSGLRHMGHKWGAIALSAIFFGVAHGLLQQSIMASALGMVLGYIAVQTGSLFPGVLLHFLHNSLVFLIPYSYEQGAFKRFGMEWAVRTVGEDGGYVYTMPVLIVCGVVTLAILLWFRQLPYKASAEETLTDALDHQGAPNVA